MLDSHALKVWAPHIIPSCYHSRTHLMLGRSAKLDGQVFVFDHKIMRVETKPLFPICVSSYLSHLPLVLLSRLDPVGRK